MNPTLTMSDAAREQRCRRVARRQGYRLSRSRWRLGSVDNWGGWQIIDANANFIVAGERWNLSLDDVEHWLLPPG